MLDCSRMTHRVHTILSILAEDHAPAALRPSILLAVDWPTVAEEAPATGDDSGIACAASGILSGIGGRENLPALTLATLPLLAARLATVAASLTATGDKAMAAHADALWGAAAALVGMPNTAAATANPAGWDGLINGIASLTHVLPFCSRADEMLDIVMRWHGAENALGALANKASNIIPGAKHTNLGDRATLIATALDRVTHWRAMVQARDTALGALGWDGAENLQAWTAHQKATLENIREALGACTGETAMGATVRVAEGYRSFKSAHAEMCVKFRDEGALVNTQIINERDRALADIHALRDILKVPEDGNLVDHASAFAERYMKVRAIFDKALGTKGATTFTLADIAEEMALQREGFKRERDASDRVLGKVRTALGWEMGKGMLSDFAAEVRKQADEADSLRAENTRLRAQVDRMSAAMREDAPTSAKPRPQPGDVVPWAEVEDGALYHRLGERCPFRMSVGGRVGAMYDADDRDILRMVAGTFGAGDPEFENHTAEHPLILVARNLGSDPEAWRAAMREWTAAGNKPPIESSRPR